MTDNLRHWKRFDDIDPKYTKPITGKAYKGTSPNPQYVIRCLTEIFGPVGEGFGWDVVAEEFTPLADEVLHWCRIRFWHTDRANAFDSYGQTKAVTIAKRGTPQQYAMVDEDAPKKSLTDAIIKAASHVGVGANIFLGRWDDQKYVAEVNAEYRAQERADAPQKPAQDYTQAIAYLQEAESQADLVTRFKRLPDGARKAQVVIDAAAQVKAALIADAEHDAAVREQ